MLVREIQLMIRIQLAGVVSYEVCELARLRLQRGDLTSYSLSFELLPAYFDLLRHQASRAHLHLQINAQNSRLERFRFIQQSLTNNLITAILLARILRRIMRQPTTAFNPFSSLLCIE